MNSEPTTLFPLRLTFDEKNKVVAEAKRAGVDPDKPGALNAFMLRKLMGALS